MSDTITFDDFAKLDIKIGKILTAEKVEKSNKLLKIEVDFGDHKRQILSGISKQYDPKDIVGKSCPFIINLEPREMMGLESQGMIMAADEDGVPVLIHPDRDVEAGSEVR